MYQHYNALLKPFTSIFELKVALRAKALQTDTRVVTQDDSRCADFIWKATTTKGEMTDYAMENFKSHKICKNDNISNQKQK